MYSMLLFDASMNAENAGPHLLMSSLAKDFVNEFWNEKIAVTLTREQWHKISVALEQEIENKNKLINILRSVKSEMDNRGGTVSGVQFWEEQIDTIKAFLSAYEAARKK